VSHTFADDAPACSCIGPTQIRWRSRGLVAPQLRFPDGQYVSHLVLTGETDRAGIARWPRYPMRARLSCVYCESRPHQRTRHGQVSAGKTFSAHLPTVPSCRPCNEAYSKDEEYFLAVIAQSGFVPSLPEKIKRRRARRPHAGTKRRARCALRSVDDVAEDGRALSLRMKAGLPM